MTWQLTAMVFASLVSAYGDALTLRNGMIVTGSWLGGDARQIIFLVNDQVRTTYPRSDVAEVNFGQEPAAAQPPAKRSDDAPQSNSGKEVSQQQGQSPVKAQTAPGPIKQGQTIDQIEAALGKPAQLVNAGGKKMIYIYKDPPVKITFQDGKVVDVE